MRKKITIATIAFVGLSSFAALGSSSALVENMLETVRDNPITKIFSAERVQKPKVSVNENAEIKRISDDETAVQNVPDEIIYFVLFNHLVGLQQQAEQLQSRGEKPFDYYELYRSQADLNESESLFLYQTAQDCVNAIKPIDDEAKRLILQARRANGEVKSLADIPPPPAELVGLQQQRDATILQFRDVLKNVWGAEKFAQFDQFARQKVAPEITALSATNLEEQSEVK